MKFAPPGPVAEVIDRAEAIMLLEDGKTRPAKLGQMGDYVIPPTKDRRRDGYTIAWEWLIKRQHVPGTESFFKIQAWVTQQLAVMSDDQRRKYTQILRKVTKQRGAQAAAKAAGKPIPEFEPEPEPAATT